MVMVGVGTGVGTGDVLESGRVIVGQTIPKSVKLVASEEHALSPLV